MKDENLKNLIDKYENGQSSLNEEKILHDQTDEINPEMKPWSEFVNNHKAKVPEEFNEELWEKFEPKTNTTRKLFISIASVAATVLLIVTLYFNFNSNQQELSYEEKEALLNQAKDMLFNEDHLAQQDIIYEDETIIIYTTK